MENFIQYFQSLVSPDLHTTMIKHWPLKNILTSYKQYKEFRHNVKILALEVRSMMIRISNEKVKRKSSFPIHLALGHEYIAASLSQISKPGDTFILTHRNIHFNLALSGKSYYSQIIDESLALPSGINKGNYGCMTLRNKCKGIIYTSSILANNISVGLGVASTMPKGNITWIQSGDGAIEEGGFYEGLVFAKARELNVILLIENNNWSLGTSIKERRKPINLKRMCSSIGIPYYKVKNCKSLFQLYLTLGRARKQYINGPKLIEVNVKTEGGVFCDDRGYVSYHHGAIKDI